MEPLFERKTDPIRERIVSPLYERKTDPFWDQLVAPLLKQVRHQLRVKCWTTKWGRDALDNRMQEKTRDMCIF